jgi:hypothetical protein
MPLNKCTITIEDMPDGSVKIETTPTFETLMMMQQSGNGWTSAHGYLLSAINRFKTISRSQASGIIVPVPRIGR